MYYLELVEEEFKLSIIFSKQYRKMLSSVIQQLAVVKN